MNCYEIKVKKIVAYAAGDYCKKFVYVEAYPEEETGLYKHNKECIEQYVSSRGYYDEQYAEYDGKKITNEEYEDDAACIDGKVVDLKGKAKLRVRYLTPYNFIICAQFHPINNLNYYISMESLLNGILKGQKSVEEIVSFVDGIKRNY